MDRTKNHNIAVTSHHITSQPLHNTTSPNMTLPKKKRRRGEEKKRRREEEKKQAHVHIE
jgi:hypothetical protein